MRDRTELPDDDGDDEEHPPVTRCPEIRWGRRCLLPAGHAGEHGGRRRRTRPRAKVISRKKLTKALLRSFDAYDHMAELTMRRPRTRGECRDSAINGERPCPWVACKHHLYLDINPETGSIKINFPDLEPWELQQTCALDVAERGGLTLEETGMILNVTRERTRQLEVRALISLKRAGARLLVDVDV